MAIPAIYTVEIDNLPVRRRTIMNVNIQIQPTLKWHTLDKGEPQTGRATQHVPWPVKTTTMCPDVTYLEPVL